MAKKGKWTLTREDQQDIERVRKLLADLDRQTREQCIEVGRIVSILERRQRVPPRQFNVWAQEVFDRAGRTLARYTKLFFEAPALADADALQRQRGWVNDKYEHEPQKSLSLLK